MGYKHYSVVGRKAPTDSDPTPQLYRMQIFAPNKVTAKSRFWYFLHQYKKMKKTTGEILSVNEIHEKNSNVVKNYSITLRYNSRSGTHNMTKEFRDVTLVGAVTQLYQEMAGLHRARAPSIQIISTAILPAKDCVRASVKQFHDGKIKFPITHRRPRVESRRWKKTFAPHRPTTFVG
ncbi:60S ribosomal protein L18a [Hondaea fermentalgiana]|uniref:60S ribosomal protein L18a n=1 Tax=Hondaea fermentalgiana TaxID=2315210 RepID=A0A2R5GYR5_9STRA|nr:60S ribosomal protein L18a [Hondaea fermentalgiana]|eukprot:GBG34958.1 60S ribosomal protein L18a [Hondaea fermentalgiana]